MKKIALLAALTLLHYGGVFASDPTSTASTSKPTAAVVAAVAASSAASSAASNAASRDTAVPSVSSNAANKSPSSNVVSTPALTPSITHSASASTTASSPTSTGNMFQALLGFGAVLALMVGLAWMAKRFNPAKAGTAGSVKIVGGVNVGNRERVLVIEVGDQWVVVGVAPGRVSALSTMAKQESIPGTTNLAETPNFANWLKKTIDKRNGQQT